MGAGASAIDGAKGADAAAISAGVAGLSAKDIAILSAALDANAGGDAIATNAKNIAQNEGDIHDLYISVMTNKQGIFEARSMIEENRSNIFQNYSATFMGNRNMANENTDAIYKNRTAILDALKVNGQVQENFRNSKYNESTIEYLNNMCLLNNRMAKGNEKMSEINTDAIAVNAMVLASNEEIVNFNAAQIETNAKLLAGIQADKATPEANAARIAANKEKITKIKERNDKYNGEMGNMHEAISANRKNLEANATAIKERRKQIVVNRAGIKENGAKVAELLRGGASGVEEITASVAGLSDDDKANLRAAIAAGGEVTEAMATNQKNISENEAKLHSMHMDVFTNKTKLYAVRAVIEENRSLIMKNYASALQGNRNVANQNTDDIFKNRTAILDGMKCDGQVQENFRKTKYNESNIDFLEHRSLINNRVAKGCVAMSAVNTKLIEVNKMIMDSNEAIVAFNSAAIETNKKLLEGIVADKCTPESNAARIEANSKAIVVINDHAAKYDEKVEAMLAKAMENRANLETNAKDIDERRTKILANRSGIIENAQKCSELLMAV